MAVWPSSRDPEKVANSRRVTSSEDWNRARRAVTRVEIVVDPVLQNESVVLGTCGKLELGEAILANRNGKPGAQR